MSKALIVIDVQNDFCPGGNLAVNEGNTIVPSINAMMTDFQSVVLTQDWHPSDHLSFASNHGADPFSTTEMPYGTQVLWPDHCIQGSTGSDFHGDLDTTSADLVVRKGYNKEIDSYSAFFENDQKTKTGLCGYLRDRGFSDLTFVGLALDFCVGWSALDAVKEGFSATVVTGSCRAIDLDGSLDAAIANMKAAGVILRDT